MANSENLPLEGFEESDIGEGDSLNEKVPSTDKSDISLQEKEIYKEEEFDENEFPQSYKSNDASEKKLLIIVENFCKQYSSLYKDRKSLFITPSNEFGVPKFVCFTLRPRELPFLELSTWNSVCSFVADYLDYIPLRPPHELPTRLYSPQTTLNIQKGTCFEYSSLLASMLIGLGYDAYVVSGYATKKVCLVDQSFDKCPLLIEEVKEDTPPPKRRSNKYFDTPLTNVQYLSNPKPLSEFKSLSVLQVDDEMNVETEPGEEEEVDPLLGLRVHSWVLVMKGYKDTDENFFIEPTTGHRHPMNTDIYLGIESIWNDKNMWICMQECDDGISKLEYDLKDLSQWEYVLPFVKKKPVLSEGISDSSLPQLIFHGTNFENDAAEEQEEEKTDNDFFGKIELKNDSEPQVSQRISHVETKEEHIVLPEPWSVPIKLTLDDLLQQCPGGKKTILYLKSKVEKFALYHREDGLVLRLTEFSDLERTEISRIKEEYKQRTDKLSVRIYDYVYNQVSEYFKTGRLNKLKEHHYKMELPMDSEPSSNRFSQHKSMHTINYEDYNVSEFDGDKLDRTSQNEDAIRLERKSVLRTSAVSTRKKSVLASSLVKFQNDEDIETTQKTSRTSDLNTNMNMHSVRKYVSSYRPISDISVENVDSVKTTNSEIVLTGEDLEDFIGKSAAQRKDFPNLVPPKALEETIREARFYSSYRFDSLKIRIETKHFTEEHYDERDDLLYYKLVEYARPKTSLKSSNQPITERLINKIVVKYRRSKPEVHKYYEDPPSTKNFPSKVDSDEDTREPFEYYPPQINYDYYHFPEDDNTVDNNPEIAEIIFNLITNRIVVTYHREYNRISSTVREFVKPNKNDEKGKATLWHPDSNYTVYLSNPSKRDKKKVALYQLMLHLMKLEEKYETMSKDSEFEVTKLLEERLEEEKNIVLENSLTQRVQEKAQKRRIMLDQLKLEEQGEKEKKDLDVLALVLAKQNKFENLSPETIEKIKEECLNEFKKRIVIRTNLIQDRYDKETSELQKRQQKFQQNQMIMTKKDEQEYTQYCTEAQFRIQILEMRLKRNMELAPIRYKALEEMLQNDPRLKPFSFYITENKLNKTSKKK